MSLNSMLKKGPGTVRSNVAQLMNPPKSQARKKAILTLSHKHNITRDAAQFRQSVAIARAQARKK